MKHGPVSQNKILLNELQKQKKKTLHKYTVACSCASQLSHTRRPCPSTVISQAFLLRFLVQHFLHKWRNFGRMTLSRAKWRNAISRIHALSYNRHVCFERDQCYAVMFHEREISPQRFCHRLSLLLNLYFCPETVIHASYHWAIIEAATRVSYLSRWTAAFEHYYGRDTRENIEISLRPYNMLHHYRWSLLLR